MKFTVVIPARYASTRLPGKPLLRIADKSMLQHVWERSQDSKATRVVVATDDGRIKEACLEFGADALMTRVDHNSGTDRLAEVVDKLDMHDEEILVNVQGDEPLIPAAVINQVSMNLQNCAQASIATLCEPLLHADALRDPNTVKVVFDAQGLALYFSRACIPYPRDYDWNTSEMPAGQWYRHLGIYAYRAGFLRRFSGWHPAALEQTESLEQLRALYAGERIHVEAACESVPGGIDTPEDLERVRKYFTGSSSIDAKSQHTARVNPSGFEAGDCSG